MNVRYDHYRYLFFFFTLFLGGCGKQQQNSSSEPAKTTQATTQQSIKKEPINALPIEVENKTGKTLFITSFTFIRKNIHSRWRWIKSPVAEVTTNQVYTFHTPELAYHRDISGVYGVLGVFENKKEAEEATYELLSDDKRVDLDLLVKLKNKRITLNVEKYGFKKPTLDFDFIAKEKFGQATPQELDFYVHNNTNKPIFVCCFAYMKKAKGSWLKPDSKDDLDMWKYAKTKILKLNPDEYGYVDIETIISDRDRNFVVGYLAIFDNHEEKLAQSATFELIDQRRKINVGNLKHFNNGLVTIESERYGIMHDVIEYTVKPIKKVNMNKLIK